MSINNLKTNIGFTLIELLVVISIIGILASMSILIFNTVKIKTRDTLRLADLSQWQKLLTLCQLELGHYPDCSPDGKPDLCDSSSGAPYKYVTSCAPCGGSFKKAILQECPPDLVEINESNLNLDPINKDPLAYHYYYFPPDYTLVNKACRGRYVLMANLEIAENPSSVICTDKNANAKYASPNSYWVILE